MRPPARPVTRLPPAAAACEPLERRTLLSFSLVADLTPGNYGSSPHFLLAHEGLLYFTALTTVPAPGQARTFFVTDGTAAGTIPFGTVPTSSLVAVGDAVFYRRGSELVRTDGTVAGTRVVRDVTTPGPVSPSSLTRAGDTLYFTATRSDVGRELWKTDGTAAGTLLVADLTPGPDDTAIDALTAVGDSLYFRVGTHELWKTDGSAAGTVLARDFSDVGIPSHAAAGAGGKLFLPVTVGSALELWATDGSADGTTRLGVIDDDALAADPQLTPVGDDVFFVGGTASEGRELWKTDGTPAGTAMLKDVLPGDASSLPRGLSAHGGALYFSADDGLHGREVWRSDGTPGGTALLHDIEPGANGSAPTGFRTFGQRLLFIATDARHGKELRVTDGTDAGATVVHEVAQGPASGVADDALLVAGDARAFFVGATALNGGEPWVTGGTPAATHGLDINESGFGTGMYPMGAVNGRVLFWAKDRVWATEGGAPTVVAEGPQFRYSGRLTTVVGDLMYFMLDSGALWRTDGTATGTFFLKTFDTLAFSDPQRLAYLGNGVSVVTMYAGNNLQLWRTDGTADGTVLVRASFPTFSSNAPAVVSAGDGVGYFMNNGDLWRTDGTDAGTYVVRRIGTSTSLLAVMDGRVYFTAPHATLGTQWWRSDGTPDGTTPVMADQRSPAGHLRAFGSALYFQRGEELWTSDGTSARKIGGPFAGRQFQPVTDIIPVMKFGDGILFELYLPNRMIGSGGAVELWHWDGTGGLHKIADGGFSREVPEAVPPYPTLAGRVYFSQDVFPYGRELWSSDGTREGSGMIADLHPGQASSGATGIAVANGSVFFEGNDGKSGRELWRFTPFAWRVGDVLAVASGVDGPDAWTLASEGAALKVTRGNATLPFSAASVTAAWLAAADEEDRLTITGSLATPLRWDGVLGGFELSAGASAVLAAGSGAANVASLVVGAGAVLDLNDNTLVVGGGDVAAIEALVASARDATPRWSGSGITSSLAASPSLSGVGVMTVGGDVIVRHAHDGDANLDGRINSDDYFRIDSGFLAQIPTPTYAQGDFNYDDRVNSDDYFLIDSAFLGQAAPAGLSPAISAAVTGDDAGSIAKRSRRDPRVEGVWENNAVRRRPPGGRAR